MSKNPKIRTDAVAGAAIPTVTDMHVGMRLGMRRMVLGIEKEDLAEVAGVTIHQIEQFEMGLLRISATRLFQFSQYLEVPVSWFFDGLGPESEILFGGRNVTPEQMAAAARDKDGFELLRFYYDSITDPLRKRSIVEVARVLAETNLKVASDKN